MTLSVRDAAAGDAQPTGWRRRDVFGGGPAKGWVPYSFVQPLLALLFLGAGAGGFYILAGGRGWTDAEGDPAGATGLIAYLVIIFSLFLAVTLIWTLLVERRSLASIGLGLKGAGVKALRGWGIGAVMILVLTGLGVVSGGYEIEGVAPAFAEPQALGVIALVLAAFLIQGGTEEAVFRGWLLSAFALRRGLRAAMLASVLLFALGHFSPDASWIAHLNIMLFGLFAALWAVREKSVVGVAAWHGGWNGLLITGFDTPVTGVPPVAPALIVDLKPAGPSHLTGGGLGPEGSILCTAIFAAGIAALAFAGGKGR